jgi:AbrB family looped-hinge helix DNA binding protein
MTVAKVTSKGQITVPKHVRTKLGLATGDELEFVEEDGCFVIRKRLQHSPFDCYVGYLKKLRGKEPDALVKELRGHE